MQSRRHSLYETLISTVVGFVVSSALLAFLSWRDDLPFSLWRNLEWTFWFTIASIIRGYGLRRFFNAINKSQK